MPDSVIKTKVDDSEFWKYVEALEKHKETLEDLSGGWAKISASAKATIKVYNTGTAALLAQNEIFHKETMELTKQQAAANKLAEAEKKRAASLKEAWNSTKQIAASIVDMTKNLLKWSGVGTILSGLMGAGSLFGLAGLADRVSDTRKAAMGLGTTTGAMQAFNLNYQRYFDAQAVMQNVAGAQSDYSKRWAFAAMGVNPMGKDPAALGAEMAQRAKSIFDRSDQSQQFAQAHGLLEFFSMNDLRALHNMKQQELDDAQKAYEIDQQNLQVTDEQNRTWQDLSVQLKRAGIQIATVFIQGLAPLVPQIVALSKSVVDTIKNFATSDTLKKIIREVGDGMKNLAKWIDSDHFQKDVRAASAALGDLAQGMIGFLKRMGWIHATAEEVWKGQSPAERRMAARALLPPTPNDPFGIKRGEQVEAEIKKDTPSWVNPETGEIRGSLADSTARSAAARDKAAAAADSTQASADAIVARHAARAAGGGGDGGAVTGPWGPRVKGDPSLAEPLIQYFMKNGKFTRLQATALVANLKAESGLSPNPVGPNDQGHAFGLAQWEDRGKVNRQADFNAWAKANNLADLYHSDLWEQAAFVNYELTQGRYAKTGAKLRGQTDLGEATDVVAGEYESPKSTDYSGRRQIAVALTLTVNPPKGANYTVSAAAVPGRVPP